MVCNFILLTAFAGFPFLPVLLPNIIMLQKYPIDQFRKNTTDSLQTYNFINIDGLNFLVELRCHNVPQVKKTRGKLLSHLQDSRLEY